MSPCLLSYYHLSRFKYLPADVRSFTVQEVENFESFGEIVSTSLRTVSPTYKAKEALSMPRRGMFCVYCLFRGLFEVALAHSLRVLASRIRHRASKICNMNTGQLNRMAIPLLLLVTGTPAIMDILASAMVARRL